jgi:leucyl aminopeptidase
MRFLMDLTLQFLDARPTLSDLSSVTVLITFEPSSASTSIDVRDARLTKQEGAFLTAQGFTGAADQTFQMTRNRAGKPVQYLFAGAGHRADFDGVTAERVAASAFAVAWKGATKIVDFDLHEFSPVYVAHAALGVRLASYSFKKYRTGTRAGETELPQLARFICDAPDRVEPHYENLAALADGVTLARDLVSEPPNILYPATFAERMKLLAVDGLIITVLDEAEMARLGMGALLSVGQGSRRETQLVVLEWNGAPQTPESRIAFVGKGVTFDSGGLSIKSAKDMEGMKTDMGGAAAVAGAMLTLARRKARVNVVAVLGLVENMPDGDALRPGDIIKSMSGQTIEIVNTDAEGRLVLADALWFTHTRYKPKVMVDMATLTGAITYALGDDYAGFLTNDDALASRLEQAASVAAEQIWRLPLVPAYDKLHDTPVADMKNVGGHPEAMAITAALFLQRFVRDCAWAHIDMSPVVWRTRTDMTTIPAGPSGFGVRLLDRLAASYENEAVA